MVCAALIYLGQLVPELIKIGENLGMDLRASNAVDVSQDTQNPPPQDKGRVSMPTCQAPTCDDADVISETLTTVCMIQQRKEEKEGRREMECRVG